tara:strand:+ start:179 stop:301 length:123 start_codon:yes stop_codon:yes gene_type:complete
MTAYVNPTPPQLKMWLQLQGSLLSILAQALQGHQHQWLSW